MMGAFGVLIIMVCCGLLVFETIGLIKAIQKRRQAKK